MEPCRPSTRSSRPTWCAWWIAAAAGVRPWSDQETEQSTAQHACACACAASDRAWIVAQACAAAIDATAASAVSVAQACAVAVSVAQAHADQLAVAVAVAVSLVEPIRVREPVRKPAHEPASRHATIAQAQAEPWTLDRPSEPSFRMAATWQSAEPGPMQLPHAVAPEAEVGHLPEPHRPHAQDAARVGSIPNHHSEA